MREIVVVLQESKLISSFDIIEMIDEDDVEMLKIVAYLHEGSMLYIHELRTKRSDKYSYHWQDRDKNLLIRWDNSPHHKNLANFPYHKHEKEDVLPSFRISIDDVLSEIESKLK